MDDSFWPRWGRAYHNQEPASALVDDVNERQSRWSHRHSRRWQPSNSLRLNTAIHFVDSFEAPRLSAFAGPLVMAREARFSLRAGFPASSDTGRAFAASRQGIHTN